MGTDPDGRDGRPPPLSLTNARPPPPSSSVSQQRRTLRPRKAIKKRSSLAVDLQPPRKAHKLVQNRYDMNWSLDPLDGEEEGQKGVGFSDRVAIGVLCA